jgi:crotonobetainyl-CoA:carnitine CoA-transferase CaiB-like acyl-CoA transferase
LWQRLCPAIGRDDLTDDPRFKTNSDRVRQRWELVSILSDHFQTRTTSEWVETIGNAGVPCGPINRISDVVTDPQVLSRDMMLSIPHPQVPDLKVPGSPLKLADTPPTVRHYPPSLGEHNEEVLTEMGYGKEEVVRFKDEGVI